MRILSLLTTFLISILLVACGGGGGSPGLSTGSTSAFSVVAPTAVTLPVGSLQQYAIKGGTKPYSVLSNNPAVAVGWIGGDDVLHVGTLVAGQATISTVDAKGSKYDIVVTSGSTTAFFTTAASAITITPGAAYAQTYTLGGGTGPYVASSSFPSVATVAINGNQMTITGVQISATASTITIRDAAGATLTVSVTVGTVPLAVNPTAITAFIGDKVRAVVTGGTRPYRVQSGIDEAALKVKIVEGNIVEAVGGQVASAAPVTIIDANNQVATLSLTLTNGQDVLRVQPNALTVPQSTTTPDITLMVYGASASGGLQVFSSNPAVLKPGTPTENSDGTGYAIKLTGGNTCSSVDANGDGDTADAGDTAGANRTITITVMDAKSKVGTSTITNSYVAGVGGCV